MHQVIKIIYPLLPLLTIFSNTVASSSEENLPWNKPFDNLKLSTSDNLFKRWEDTQVSIHLEPNSKK